MRANHFSKPKMAYLVNMFLLFLVVFMLVQLLMYLISKAFLPYQVFIDAKGWIVKTTFLVVVETIIMSFIAALLCVRYIHQVMGPVPRVIDNLQQTHESGKYNEIKVRKNDRLKPLFDEFNKIITSKNDNEANKNS